MIFFNGYTFKAVFIYCGKSCGDWISFYRSICKYGFVWGVFLEVVYVLFCTPFQLAVQLLDLLRKRSHFWFLVYLCKIMISSGVFFHFFKILIFSVVRRVKGQKMAQNDKGFCLSHSSSQEPYLIWLWFLVQMWKKMISPAIFFVFSKFWFFGFLGRGEVKG